MKYTPSTLTQLATLTEDLSNPFDALTETVFHKQGEPDKAPQIRDDINSGKLPFTRETYDTYSSAEGEDRWQHKSDWQLTQNFSDHFGGGSEDVQNIDADPRSVGEFDGIKDIRLQHKIESFLESLTPKEEEDFFNWAPYYAKYRKFHKPTDRKYSWLAQVTGK